ncbi:hypothetical protein D4764_12G0012340 [Takifugu flavidus]|uniref:Uncharacterized protein n=1 Tax=Takifugu flavidus TaxID=433684 RepID=A0A5C6PDF9_9TELE|nr:hypothetical protein D4764_12G0012340 [Takifugu flavidus]
MATAELADTTVWGGGDVVVFWLLLFVSRICVPVLFLAECRNLRCGSVIFRTFSRGSVFPGPVSGTPGEHKDLQKGLRSDRSVCRFHDSKGCPSLPPVLPVLPFPTSPPLTSEFTSRNGPGIRAGRSLRQQTSKKIRD